MIATRSGCDLAAIPAPRWALSECKEAALPRLRPLIIQPLIAMTHGTHADASSTGASIDTTEILVTVVAAVVLAVAKRLL